MSDETKFGKSERCSSDADFKKEMERHLELEAEEQRAAGAPAAAARAAALRAFGNPAMVGEEVRAVWHRRWLEDAAQDFRFGARQLAQNPTFAAIAILALAFGIGANSSIFSLMNSMLLRPLPVERPAELERVDDPHHESYFSYPMYQDLRDRNRVFSSLLARQISPASLSFTGRSERGVTEVVSGNYFDTLGVKPLAGRLIRNDDDTGLMEHPVAVLSYRYWKERLGADPDAVGKVIHINNYPFTVIGIAPPEFSGVEIGAWPDVWAPIAMQPQVFNQGQPVLNNTGVGWLNLMGRRAAGISHEQALSGLNVTFRQIVSEGRHKLFRTDPTHATLALMAGGTGFSELRANLSNPLFLLGGVVIFILLMACANIANLLLVRSAARSREIAVRLAIGAGRLRLIRQMLVESLLLSGIGGAAGYGLSIWSTRALLGFLPSGGILGATSVPLKLEAGTDARVLLFVLAISVATGVIFGFAPAMQAARTDVIAALKEEGSARSNGRRFGARSALVVAQVAISVVLLVGAALFLRTLRRAMASETGINTENVLMASMNPFLNGYDIPKTRNFYRELERRLETQAGVTAVGTSDTPLLSNVPDTGSFIVPGKPLPAGPSPKSVVLSEIDGDYFGASGTKVIAGRKFTAADGATGGPAVILNQSAVNYWFPGEQPIGQKVFVQGVQNVEIVGIVQDSTHSNLREAPQRIAYIPSAQDKFFDGERTVYVRTVGDPARLTGALRRAVQELDSDLPIYDVKTLAQQKRDSLARERMIAALSEVFGGLSLLLASIGLYGVMAYSVSRRTREIGIRLSLGAKRPVVLWMVLRDCLVMVVCGIAVGAPLAMWLAGLVRAQLFGVAPGDPVAFAFGVGVLALVGAAAGAWPSYRASRVDPLVALRYE